MIAIIVSIASAVGAGVIMLFIGRMRGPVRIRRIMQVTDQLVEPTLVLYQRLFPEDEGTNYRADELLECMDERFVTTHHVDVVNIMLVATFKGSVVGFLFAHLYPTRRKAIISYFGVDKKVREVRIDSIAAKKLAIVLIRTLRKQGNCDHLFYDLERIGPKTPAYMRKRKMGRAGLFRVRAKTMNLEAQEFKFQYLCPKISMSDFAQEKPFVLFCIELSEGPRSRELPKETILEYLRFVYLDCYGDNYSNDDPGFSAYQGYLQKLISHYEETLPDIVVAA